MLSQHEIELLSDPIWRLNNLYKIVTKKDGIQPFNPLPYQNDLYHQIFRLRRRKHIVIKARRMGFSTALDVMAADLSFFNEDLQSSIVDLTQADAHEKMRSKVKVAWDQALKEGWPQQLGIKHGFRSDGHRSWTTGSHIYAGINARGGTNHFLHVSEWGPIAHKDPKRSKEILTGALPSADEGVVVVETTWMGGKHGELWALVKEAMETPEELKTDQDFWFNFYPWFVDPRHTLSGDRPIDSTTLDYLQEITEKTGHTFTKGQALWYLVNSLRYKEDMTQEYPSTPEEAFERKVVGSIYGKWVSGIRAQNQICDFPLDPRVPVDIFCDLGIADYLPLWFTQFVGKEIRLFDWYENNNEGLTHYAQIISKWETCHNAVIRCIYLPHDGDHKQLSTGETIAATLRSLLPHIEVKIIPRTPNVWYGIDWLRDNFPRIWIHKTNCGTERTKDGIDHPSGLDCIENYHVREAVAGTNTSKEPVHDMYSHSCDGLRTLAEAVIEGKINSATGANKFVDPGAVY